MEDKECGVCYLLFFCSLDFCNCWWCMTCLWGVFLLSYTVGQCFYIVSKRRIMYIMYSLKLWKVGRCVVVVKCVVFRVIVLLFVSCDFFKSI